MYSRCLAQTEKEMDLRQLQHLVEQQTQVLPPDASSVAPSNVIPVTVFLAAPPLTAGATKRPESIVWFPQESHPFVKRLVLVPASFGPPLWLYNFLPSNLTSLAANPPPMSAGAPTPGLFGHFVRDVMIPVMNSLQPAVSPTFLSVPLQSNPRLYNTIGRCIEGYVHVASNSVNLVGVGYPTGTLTAASVVSLENFFSFSPSELVSRADFPKNGHLNIMAGRGSIGVVGPPYAEKNICGALELQKECTSQRDPVSGSTSMFALVSLLGTGANHWISPYISLDSTTPLPVVETLLLHHPSVWTLPDIVASVQINSAVPTLDVLPGTTITMSVSCYSTFMQQETATGEPKTYHTATVQSATYAVFPQQAVFTFSMSDDKWAFSSLSAQPGLSVPSEAVWVGSLLVVSLTSSPIGMFPTFRDTIIHEFKTSVNYPSNRRYSQDARVWRLDNLGDGQTIQVGGHLVWQMNYPVAITGLVQSAQHISNNPVGFFDSVQEYNNLQGSPRMFVAENKSASSAELTAAERKRCR